MMPTATVQNQQKITDYKLPFKNETQKKIAFILTGIPAAHGEDAVAALDSELVEPYRTRLGNDCSLNDSDGTLINKTNSFNLESPSIFHDFSFFFKLSNSPCCFSIFLKLWEFGEIYLFPECRCFLHRPAIELYYAIYPCAWKIVVATAQVSLAWQSFLWPNVPFHVHTPFLFASIAINRINEKQSN